MSKFTYNIQAISSVYNGTWFDSLLELRYILSIEETHCWIRDGLSIYYNLDLVPEGIKGGLKTYTPDFLVREKQTGIAKLVELKPSEYDDRWELIRRRKIAENYIQFMGFDWEFEVIFSHQIVLSHEAQIKFDHFLHMRRIGLTHPQLGKYKWQSLSYADFIMYGVAQADVT